MKLLPEHNRNFTPALRSGVCLLTLRGEVVHISYEDHIFRSIIETQDHDSIPFDGFAWLLADEHEGVWLEAELRKQYKLKP